MTNKEWLIEVLRELPEDAPLEQMVEDLAVRIAIRRGQEDIRAGRVLSHQEMKRRVASWSDK